MIYPKKILLVSICYLFCAFAANGQNAYMTSEGFISFFSSTPIEDIKAENKTVGSVIDLGSGNIVFKIQIKDFKFPKNLMQTHFNENYLESDKYPFAIFKGSIKDFNAEDFSSNKEVKVVIKGTLTMHGVSKEIEVSGVFKKDGDKLHGTADFKIEVADYDIDIPSIVITNIAEIVDVHVEMNYKKK